MPVLRVIEVSILFSQVNAFFFFRFFSSAYSFKRFTESADFWPLFAQNTRIYDFLSYDIL